MTNQAHQLHTQSLRPSLIEQLHALPVTNSTKIDLLLVYLGEKPATHVNSHLAMREPGLPQRVYDAQSIDDLPRWARAAGLFVEDEVVTLNPHAMPPGLEGRLMTAYLKRKGRLQEQQALAAEGWERRDRNVYVASSQDWLRRIVLAHKAGDSIGYGRAVGFPEPAIAAYAADTCVSPRDCKVEIELEAMAFARFMVSKDYARGDLETARRWSRAVQSADPDLFAWAVEFERNPPRAEPLPPASA